MKLKEELSRSDGCSETTRICFEHTNDACAGNSFDILRSEVRTLTIVLHKIIFIMCTNLRYILIRVRPFSSCQSFPNEVIFREVFQMLAG